MSLEVVQKEKAKRRRSASQLKTFRSCPEAFRLARILRVPQRESAASVQGSAFHAAAERWERSGRMENPVVAYTQEYGRRISELEEKVPRQEWRVWGRLRDVDQDILNRQLAGQEQIKDYTANVSASRTFPVLLPDDSLGVEVSFEMDIGSCIVVGSIDILVDDTSYRRVKVRDLKTGTKESTPIQLGIYALAAREIFDMDVWEGDFYYGKDNTFSETYDLRRFTKDYISGQFEIMEEAIENRLLFPSPGSDCFTCSVRRHCRELGVDPR